MRKFGFRAPGRPLLLCLFTATLLALAHAEARADEVQISGSTNACFGVGCVPPSTAGPHTVGVNGLLYDNSEFNGTTTNGTFTFNGSPNRSSNFQNFGSFIMASNQPASYDTTFTLRVFFNTPDGVSPVNFTADVTGTISNTNTGSVFIDFDNTPILFTFNDPICEPPAHGVPGQLVTCGSGQFFLSINDLTIAPGQLLPLTGQVTGAQQSVPEPATLVLLGTGLAGLTAKARRRKKSAKPVT